MMTGNDEDGGVNCYSGAAGLLLQLVRFVPKRTLIGYET